MCKFVGAGLCAVFLSGCSLPWAISSDMRVLEISGSSVRGVAGEDWTPVQIAQKLGRAVCKSGLPRKLLTEPSETGLTFQMQC